MDEEIYRRPGHLISRTARLMYRLTDAAFQPLGLASAQLPVFGALKDGVAKTPKELAEMARIEQPTMTQLLARMERDGLVRRTPHPEDRRSTLISLTPKALRRLPQAREIMLEGNRTALKGFSAAETEMLCSLLRRVIRNLDPDAKLVEPK